jgi:hypothetical protein
MLYQLVKRDPAWKIGVLSGMVALLPMLAASPSRPLTVLVAITPILCLFAIARPQQRATLFEAALPVPARALFLARFASLAAAVWCPIAVYGATGPDWSVSLLEWAALATLLILLPLTARVHEFSCPVWIVAAVWITGIAAGAAGLYFLSPAVFLALCALFGVAVFLKTWFAIPPSFQTAPLEAVAPRSRSLSPGRPAPVWWIFARHSFPWIALFYIPIMLGQSIQGNWAFACCFFIAAYSQGRLSMRWLESLPVPRRAFLLLALLPAVLPMVIGAAFTGAGRDQVRTGSGEFPGSSDARRAGTATVQVPLEYWRHAPDGVAPVISSPWGETVQPKLVTYLRYPLYNPYGVGPQNSARFMEWQYRRARQAVDRQPFTQPRVRVLCVAAIFVLTLVVAWLLELQAWFRLDRFSHTARGPVLLALLGFVVVCPLLFDVVHIGQSTRPVSTALLRGQLLRIAIRLPDNLAVVVALAAVPVLLLLWILDRQIRESEWPDATLLKPRA